MIRRKLRRWCPLRCSGCEKMRLPRWFRVYFAVTNVVSGLRWSRNCVWLQPSRSKVILDWLGFSSSDRRYEEANATLQPRWFKSTCEATCKRKRLRGRLWTRNWWTATTSSNRWRTITKTTPPLKCNTQSDAGSGASRWPRSSHKTSSHRLRNTQRQTKNHLLAIQLWKEVMLWRERQCLSKWLHHNHPKTIHRRLLAEKAVQRIQNKTLSRSKLM